MILVTGATGTVGGHLVAELDKAGAPMRALVRSPEKADTLKGYNVAIATGDLAQPQTLPAALAGVDRVFLLSPPAREQPALEKALIDAAVAAGSKQHIVKLAVIGHAPEGPVLGRNHAEVVDHLKASGLPYTVLAPSSYMQNLLRGAATIQGQGAIYQPAGSGAISHIDARDIAAVAAHVLTTDGHEGKDYALTGPAALTYTEVAEILTGVLGRQVTYVDVAPEQARQGMLAAGMDEWLVGALLELSDIYKAGYATTITDEVTKATGRPARTVEEFVRDHRGAFG
ncbi:MAG: SDR family oxidoreductase [Mycobacteriales bacterium]